MGQRATCFITIGGRISAAGYRRLAAHIADDGLSTAWEREPFGPDLWSGQAPLHLYALEVNNGEVPEIEAFCCDNGLAYRRISGGCLGAYGSEIVVCHGDGKPDDLPPTRMATSCSPPTRC